MGPPIMVEGTLGSDVADGMAGVVVEDEGSDERRGARSSVGLKPLLNLRIGRLPLVLSVG